MTLKPDGALPYVYTWTGAGENGAVIGTTEVDRSTDRVIGVDLFAGDDGGNTWRPSHAKLAHLQRKSLPSITNVTLAAESDGDNDYDDAVHFIYLGLCDRSGLPSDLDKHSAPVRAWFVPGGEASGRAARQAGRMSAATWSPFGRCSTTKVTGAPSSLGQRRAEVATPGGTIRRPRAAPRRARHPSTASCP
ncbi:hypothetical protein [Streptomyces sp. NPDC091259]|uniref:hypothetical protein n=1 Tax=Streptomyces sp. NPDC091259 TaxID=3365976 RepID=UPI00381D3189